LGLSLIAFGALTLPLAVTLSELPSLLWLIFQVACALGAVIFVHELGHFAVAKWCGVKCEKFYLGFDIYGLKLFKFQYGETEYGIGILPLGGYVKMLGQDDNPSHAAQQREESTVNADIPNAVVKRTADGGTIRLDPRSYIAKSVPQRMAIISAGVIMNVIFAFIFAVIAYALGVPEVAAGVSSTMPGEPAWRADLQPGDRILRINDSEGPVRFGDLRSAVALTDVNRGVDFLIQRPGVEKPFEVNIKPDMLEGRLMPMVGVAPPLTLSLDRAPIVVGGSPADDTHEFKVGDRITAIDGQPVDTHEALIAQLYAKADQPVKLTVVRRVTDTQEDKDSDATRIFTITVPPRQMKTLGLTMTMGPITAVQALSPAAEAGLRPGDLIEAINGNPPGDPMKLPEQLRGRAGETVTLTISREKSPGERETLEKQITLRDRPWPEKSLSAGSPLSIPALGLAYRVNAKIAAIDPDGPAAKAKVTKDGQPASPLAEGDEIAEAELQLPKLTPEEKSRRQADKTAHWPTVTGKMKFSADLPSWPALISDLQDLPPGTEVILTLSDGRKATLTPAELADEYYFDRGLLFSPEMITIKADSFQSAIALGARQTKDALLTVYKFLRRIGTQVSPFALGGPVTIVRAAGGEASEGFSRLLLFLTMLSGNLAVLNFLPIPLLDGGHMVFLIAEGILRRPVSEKVVIAFHYLGFVFIISMMLFVLSLDVGLISRF
jgi:regulator of sigma E protease